VSDWSPDGRYLIYTQTSLKTRMDLWVLPLEGERKPAPFLDTEFLETQGQFSPDGHWIVYASDESGMWEVYVRPFPAAPGKWKISIGGGQHPRWRRDGMELFYLGPGQKLTAVAVKAAVSVARPVFEVAAPQPLFDTRIPSLPPGFVRYHYTVAADGKRFLVNTAGSEIAEAPLTLVLNWRAAKRGD